MLEIKKAIEMAKQLPAAASSLKELVKDYIRCLEPTLEKHGISISYIGHKVKGSLAFYRFLTDDLNLRILIRVSADAFESMVKYTCSRRTPCWHMSTLKVKAKINPDFPEDSLENILRAYDNPYMLESIAHIATINSF